MPENQEVLSEVVIKFAGESGDGMQLKGSQFTNNTALLGIDLPPFPDFPAEIRAPIGTLPGVSGFQVRFSSDSRHLISKSETRKGAKTLLLTIYHEF